MSWNDERVETLKKLWSEGLSASQIASRIGGVTRNAVIGKVHRLGLSGRAPTSRTSSARPRPRIAAPRRPAKPRFSNVGAVALRQSFQLEAEPYVSTYEELDIPVSERKSLLDLVESSCRWPIGDPQTAEFHFCNRSKVTGLPYCEFHARRAFQPAQPRRRERAGEPAVAFALPTAPVAAPATPDAMPVDAAAKEPVDA
jgi:GcrA cell cycle regulator